MAIKNANIGFYDRSVEDLENEFLVLKEIHQNGNKIGIVPAPHAIFYGSETGFLMDRQDCDGTQLCNHMKSGYVQATPIEIEKMVDMVVSGLDNIHNSGYYHGDGKSGNLLFNNEKKDLMICDFGGARKFSNLVPLDQFPTVSSIFGAHTNQFVSHDIYMAVEEILKQFQPLYEKETSKIDKENLLKEMLNEIVPLLIKNDKFAFGLALFDSLTASYKELRFEKNIDKMPSLSKSNREMIEQKINEKAEFFQWTEQTKATIKMLMLE